MGNKNHSLVSRPGHKVCLACGAALRPNGDWWFAGLKHSTPPPCGFKTQSDWKVLVQRESGSD